MRCRPTPPARSWRRCSATSRRCIRSGACSSSARRATRSFWRRASGPSSRWRCSSGSALRTASARTPERSTSRRPSTRSSPRPSTACRPPTRAASGSKPSSGRAAVMGGAESAGHLWFRGEYGRALTPALRERTFSASFGNFGWTILSNTRLGQIYPSLGDSPKATEALTRTVTLLEGDLKRQTFEAAGLPAVLSPVWLAFCLAECGNAREAAALAEEATAIAEAEDHAYSLVIAHAGTGMLRNLGGDHEGAIAPLERGLVIARLADIPLLFPLAPPPLRPAVALTRRTEGRLRPLEDARPRGRGPQWGAHPAPP